MSAKEPTEEVEQNIVSYLDSWALIVGIICCYVDDFVVMGMKSPFKDLVKYSYPKGPCEM